MKNRYSVGGWLNFVKDCPYKLLPERVGVRLEPDEKMYIFKKDSIRHGYYTEHCEYEMHSFINNALANRGEWDLFASNTYEPIFALDRRITLGKVEIEYLKAYLHMWRDMDIIGFTKRCIGNNHVSTFMEKTVINEENGEIKSSIAFNIPSNKFLAMEDDRFYTLEELGLDDEPEEGPLLYKDDHIWKVGELYPGEFDKEDD